MVLKLPRGLFADEGGDRREAGLEDVFGQPEGAEESALALAADAGDERQAQPVGQTGGVDGSGQGVRTVSLTLTGAVASTTRP